MTDFVPGGVFTWRIGQEIIPRFVIFLSHKTTTEMFLLSFGEAEVDEYDDNLLIDSVRFQPAKKVLIPSSLARK